MTEHDISFDPATVDPERLQRWFPVAEAAEITARLADHTALIDYLSFCNDLTRAEAEEMVQALSLSPPLSRQDRTLRAA